MVAEGVAVAALWQVGPPVRPPGRSCLLSHPAWACLGAQPPLPGLPEGPPCSLPPRRPSAVRAGGPSPPVTLCPPPSEGRLRPPSSRTAPRTHGDCGLPSCLPAATQVDPRDLQELFQETAASVFRINSSGESESEPEPQPRPDLAAPGHWGAGRGRRASVVPVPAASLTPTTLPCGPGSGVLGRGWGGRRAVCLGCPTEVLLLPLLLPHRLPSAPPPRLHPSPRPHPPAGEVWTRPPGRETARACLRPAGLAARWSLRLGPGVSVQATRPAPADVGPVGNWC